MTIDKHKQNLLDYNYVAAMGLLASKSIIGEFLDTFKYSIFNRGGQDKQFNIFFIKEPTSKPQKILETGEDYFKERHLPFRFSFAPGIEEEFLSALTERGYKEDSSDPVMTLMNLPDNNAYQNDLDIRQVSTSEELADFQRVVEISYSLPEGAGPFVITDKVLLMPEVEMYVGYVDNHPACVSMIYQTGDLGGIYYVGTLGEFRKRGLGKAITTHAAMSAKNRGCTFVGLQASKMGRPVYERLGFDNPYNYRNFSLT